MTEQELREGFAAGRTITQEEWATRDEVAAIDKLVAEGLAEVVHGWEYLDSFQCERRVVKGIPQ